ncbi:AQG_2a_G0043920.mRNA.1.CDS.1 [Saccharomyces cerevisiae]|uniref:Elp6p n=5 Tax=Saccharomyces TaxID=4930 RepID=C8ZFI3_YEAS8|nr:Elp6p [Saccharomyces cerevisiae YJM993]AJP41007.1 Elp6p [Saccharomyces cerevisiae YJM1078]AJS62179.1 Elp6p [Saccharomyces cerevisiae YJM189]AJS63489.1 Elp6p [Saccharomyces cerevisiae YJM244]AJS63923.1 Elp6p [Saccharomyces cerevisiae YJM248]AJS64361.1 Elp6p [Saccharomyces cerevisiae YJM270]AJS64796.1 Elp6p [Saccharomyces cerevisiae YJM271]AJS65231.1 Elp6p [Saccharomyces cerevisiae YJM320]AJS66101.1 Elp6p [Saccharomyces cerevisiae YJM428]AJS66536.1 Elp6p [Saccharomyces cerevisiae YJM450]
MSSVQRQDLVLFSDQSVLPAHFFQDSNSHNLFFITHQSCTQPLWMINALVETHVLGSPSSLNESSSSMLPSSTRSHAVLASFIHEQNYFTNSLNKLKIPSNNYNVLDFLSDFIVNNIHNKPRDKILSDVLAKFSAAIQNNPTDTIVIIEQPELLLSLVSGLTCSELNNKFITPLLRQCKVLIIVSNSDIFNIDEYDASVHSSNLQNFYKSSFIKSMINLNLNPLKTGFAKDVTGSLHVCRGGAPIATSNTSLHVVENEYLYLNEKESTKLFYR